MHAQTEFDLSAGFAKSDALLAKRAAANALKRDTKAVNDALYGMGRTYQIPSCTMSTRASDSGPRSHAANPHAHRVVWRRGSDFCK